MKESEFTLIVESLSQDSRAVNHSQPGLCRMWVHEAIRVLREYRTVNNLSFRIEARQVELEPELFHTFIRILADDKEPLILDGTGTANFPAYFGQESEALHLLNSTIDPIQRYELLDETIP